MHGLLILVSLLGLVCCQDETLESVKAGLEVAEGLGAVMESGDFSKTMRKLATAAGPFLGAIGPAIGFIMLFTNQKDPHIEFMKEMLSKIENRFDKVDQKFDEVKKLIDWSKVQIQLADHESTIKTLSHALENLYKADKVTQEDHKDRFIRLYESMWADDPLVIYNHIDSTGVFHGNLLDEAKAYTENHRSKVQRFMLGLTDLVLRGVSVELSYHQLQNKTAFRNEREKYWKDVIGKMRRAMKRADSSIARGYTTQMKKDVDKLLVNNRGKSHSDFASTAYNFLMEKFNWRDWLVISYNELNGGSKHWQRVCSGYLKFRNQGRNIAIASVPRYRTPIGKNRKSEAQKIMNDLGITKVKKTGLFKWGRRTVIKGADEIYKSAPGTVTKRCYPYSAFGVIRAGSGTAYKAPKDRLLRKHKSYKRYKTKYDIHIFG